MWINSFDIGLGNGLRNKLAEAMANDNKILGRKYVSTTFFMLIFLMGILIIVGSLLFPLINWYSILNASPEYVHSLDNIVYITFLIFCLNFIFKFIGNVYLAMQLPAINNLMVVSGHLLSLIIIYILTLTTSGNLFLVALVYSLSPLMVYLIMYPLTFCKIYKFLSPSIKYFNKTYIKSLLSIGIQFFILQLSALLLFSFANILISHKFGPESVTPYNIAFRYFSLITMVMAIILSPMWSATTDAYSKGDINWIKSTMRKIRKIIYGAFGILLIMVLISKYVYQIWIGDEVNIPISISIMIAIYISIIISSLSYSNFLNGLGKLRLQTINTVISAILFYPLCNYLGDLQGIIGIISGMCVLNLSGLILNAIQYNKVIGGQAKGIWNI